MSEREAMRKLGCCGAGLCLVLVLSGANLSVRALPADGALGSQDNTAQEQSNGPAAGAQGDSASSQNVAGKPSDQEYVIGPGDLLSISVWKEPDLTRVLLVRPDGKISMPLIGEVEVSGLTPVKLRNELTQKLKTYISTPEVTVIVQEAKAHTFNIVGLVAKAGTYDLSKPITVLDAIAAAGGLQEFAKAKKIYVLRTMPDGTKQRLPFNYKAVIKGEGASQNVQLQAGDTIVVP